MSEYLSGKELWNKFDAAYRQAFGLSLSTPFDSLVAATQKAWNLLAAELKIPRPKVLTLAEVYDLWEDDFEFEDRATEEELEILRQRLNAAHEAKERKP